MLLERMTAMRLIKNYMFKIGTKIPFSEWPEIVHRFLSENLLVSQRFLYYFEDILSYHETPDDALPRSGCAKILKDCPSLGKIRYHNGKPHNRSDELWLTNIDLQDDFPESKLLPLMKKIHRRYGFCESNLYYFDINFFGNRTYFERDYSVALQMSKTDKIPFDPTLHIECQPYGSGITLHRDACAENYLKLSVDILHDGIVMDATPYYEAMQRLLPQIKVTASLEVYLSEAEKQHIVEIDQAAAPMLQKCRDFLTDWLLFTPDQNAFPSNYSVAKPLKKLAKKYGYTYKLVWNGGVYSLEKRTTKGNVIYIEVVCGPSHYNLGLGVSYQGLGFNHTLGYSNQTPTNQQETDAFLEHTISAVSELENAILPALDDLYPETPSWFIPSDLS